MDIRDRFLDHVERIRAPLMAYLRGVLLNPSDLPDALQSALLTAYRRFSEFQEGTEFRAWVLRIATLTAFETNRKAGAVHALPEDVPAEVELEREYAYEEILREPERMLQTFDQDVRRAVLELTEHERAALLLMTAAGCRGREAAAVLDMPMGSVMGYVARARGKLRERLAEFARERGLLGRSP